jgi:hypothetical protein
MTMIKLYMLEKKYKKMLLLTFIDRGNYIHIKIDYNLYNHQKK